MRSEGAVRVLPFDEATLKTFADISGDVVAEAGTGDDLSVRIYQSYLEFRSLIGAWSGVADGAYLSIRALS